MEQKIYSFGNNSKGQLGQGHQRSCRTPQPAKEIKNFAKLAVGSENGVYLNKENNLISFGKYPLKAYKFEDDEVEILVAGYTHFLILTKKGLLYGFGNGSDNKFHSQKQSHTTWTEMIDDRIKFFDNLSPIQEVFCSSLNSFVLLKNNCLHGTGWNARNELGLGESSQNKNWPQIANNVEKFFTGIYGHTAFYISTDNILYSFGDNGKGQCSVDHFEKIYRPTKATFTDTDNIKHISCSYSSSFLLTNDGDLYGCGQETVTGLNEKKSKFTKIEFFNDHFLVQMDTGNEYYLALTIDMRVFICGYENSGIGFENSTSTTIPKEIKIDGFLPNEKKQIYCGSKSSFIFSAVQSSLVEDFSSLLKNGYFSDFKINDIPVHKLLIKIRTNGKNPEVVKNLLEQKYDKKNIDQFLKYVYGHGSINLVESILIDLQIVPKDCFTLNEDLLKIYKDEESKDYTILVKNDDDDDDYEEEEDGGEDEMDESFEEIPVHKLLLIARSGLFREMFNSIKGNTNSVKDFSGISIESLEILIKFFYTNKLELTADDDPQLVVDELAEAVEYYQLNQSSELPSLLQEIKMTFGLNQKD
ncbi:hypothetical protein M0813_14318 [Anaeramoeba flamelloides]|uniref:BTB domain-containing protein n=1 Tax=Anaeramoeba flamelloides TaxID=1746091 RepID=A0ABQ8Z5I8_9EUKA|nr:hypothetical protein M0813_14318 [Anaeramoeba flamelloides]